jgi:4-diphosphocytidyl-2-C-methyl-D-erythritol kinase
MKTPPVKSSVPITLSTPAKINWFLRVTGKRNDGYHDIHSIMHYISLYDQLTFGNADSIEVSGNLDIAPEENLVYKAAHHLRNHTGVQSGARIVLKKNIPVGAGLGGGSSDAACALLGLNYLWNLSLSIKELHKLAEGIGSDVPFFFHGPCALIEGRGEKVHHIRDFDISHTLLLVKPDFSVSTKWAYSHYDELSANKLTKKTVDIKLFCQALINQDSTILRNLIENDLEKVVCTQHPVISRIKKVMLRENALASTMSGSGPTVFGIFKNRTEAEKAAQHMLPYWTSVVETLV